MSKVQHTPGPWVLVEKYGKRESDGHPFVNRSIVTEYVHPQAKDRLPVVDVAQNSAGPCLWLGQEDGHLIASAPDLLEALRTLADMVGTELIESIEANLYRLEARKLRAAIEAARAAIAKAEGGEA